MRIAYVAAAVTALAGFSALAAGASTYGNWTAYCAADAGCALATAAKDGHRLAFSEPSHGEDRLVFLPLEPIQQGSRIVITFDGEPGADLGPGDGWRMVEMPGGVAAQIAPSVAENELMVRMPTRTSIEFSYTGESGKQHRAALSLDGYSKARAFVTQIQ